MERLDKRIASHPGTVTKVSAGFVDVEIVSTSACASCEAHGKCGFADSKNKTVSVPSAEWQQYQAGEQVTVHIDESKGLLAVWIAYLLPAVLMIGAIVALSLSGCPEWAVALSAIGVLAIYTGGLFLLRKRIGRRFTLTITKQC